MSDPSSEAAPVSNAPSPGQIIGARFVVERIEGSDGLGRLLAARDQKTSKSVLLRILDPSLFRSPQAADVLRTEIRLATTTTHKHLAAVFGTGTDSGTRFVASEWLAGKVLSEWVAERRAAGDPIPLREACALVAQLCDAVVPLHARGSAHGAIRPSVIRVSDAGMKLHEVGLGRAVLRTAGPEPFGADAHAYLAPELRAGPSEPGPATDVFGIGGVLYTLTSLRSPAEEFIPPSRAHPDGSPALDGVLLRCLAPDPSDRFATVQEIRKALEPFLRSAAEIPVDVDVDIPLSIAPPSSAATPAVVIPKSPRTPGVLAAPTIGQRISIHEEFRPSALSLVPEDQPIPAPSAQVDLGALLKKITENDAPRWMAQYGGLDHGPFSGRELVELIARGEVQGEHGLLNMDTGERRKVAEWPDFAEFVEQHRLKRALEAESRAIAQSAKLESRSNVAKFIIAGAIVCAIVLMLGAFLYTRQARQEEAIAMSDLADLYERGEVRIEGAAGILPDPPATTRRARPTGGSRPSGGAGRTYEEAMSEVVDIGDATRSGNESRLTPAQVAGVMNAQINSMFGCVSAELRSGRSPGRVRIDIAIAGSGQVLGSSVRAGSPEFQRCIQARVAAVRFPPFGAPRMGASYSFDASQ